MRIDTDLSKPGSKPPRALLSRQEFVITSGASLPQYSAATESSLARLEALVRKRGVPAYSRKDQVHYLRLAEASSFSVSSLKRKYRARVESWVKIYGLKKWAPEFKKGPITVSELSKVAIAERQRELELTGATAKVIKVHLNNLRNALRSAGSGDADARQCLTKAVENAPQGAGCSTGKLRHDLIRCMDCLDSIEKNNGLPLNFADLLEFLVQRRCESMASVERQVGLSSLNNWRRGTVPALWQYDGINCLEKYWGYEKGEFTSRIVQPRSAISVPIHMLPAEMQLSATRKKILPLLTPSDLTGDTATRHACLTAYNDQVTADRAPQELALAMQSVSHFALHDWPATVQGQFEKWRAYRMSNLVPYGMKRDGKPWRWSSTNMMRTYLARLFGTWCSELNEVFRIRTEDLTMGYLVFGRLIHIRLEFAIKRMQETYGVDQGFITPWEFDYIRQMRALLDPETGWITQTPDLAENLKPIIGLNGETIVSEAEIGLAKQDWPAACVAAREYYRELRQTHRKSVQRSRDSHVHILAILKMDNPLKAFRLLCGGLRNDLKAAIGREAKALALRDVVLGGVLTQTGFRALTAAKLNLGDVVYNKVKKTWNLRVHRRKFKNPNGPYFVSGKQVREYYERELKDKHGLYEAIDAYLRWGRAQILQEISSDAFFVCGERRRPGKRRKEEVSETGRVTASYLRKLVHKLTARHIGYKPGTKTGIPGIVSFPTAGIRHIIATGMLKRATRNAEQVAADAIHDSIDTILEHYVRYVPRDREKPMMEVIDEGW